MAELFVGGLTLSTDDRGRLHFWGEVFNTGQRALRWVMVRVRLLGQGGKHLAEMADMTALEWTLPQARNPFYLRFVEPPAGWQSFNVELTAQEHDFADQTVPQPHPGLYVDRVHYREIDRADLRCTILGLLHNSGPGPATQIKAAGTLYNAEGKVIGVFSPYLVPKGIFAPGDLLPFEIKFYAVGGVVANYRLQVQGRIWTG